VVLSVVSTEKGQARFSYKADGGSSVDAGGAVELKGLLPWDSGLRVGLVVDGAAGSTAQFSNFNVFDHLMK